MGSEPRPHFLDPLVVSCDLDLNAGFSLDLLFLPVIDREHQENSFRNGAKTPGPRIHVFGSISTESHSRKVRERPSPSPLRRYSRWPTCHFPHAVLHRELVTEEKYSIPSLFCVGDRVEGIPLHTYSVIKPVQGRLQKSGGAASHRGVDAPYNTIVGQSRPSLNAKEPFCHLCLGDSPLF